MKILFFHLSPRIPAINLTPAYTILQKRGHSDTRSGMANVKFCHAKRMGGLCGNFIDRLDEQLSVLEELNSAQAEEQKIVVVASSFLPPNTQPTDDMDHRRNKRVVGFIAAAAGSTRMTLGNPIKDATCSAVSIFNLCPNNKHFQESVHDIISQKHQFRETVERVQICNDKSVFTLRHEVNETQKSV